MVLDNFLVENIPHTVSVNKCQMKIGKYKYLCDATFLNVRVAHAVHKEFLVSVNFFMTCLQKGVAKKLGFIVSFLQPI